MKPTSPAPLAAALPAPETPMAMAFPVLGTSSAFVATGWMPVIHHPDRTAPYTRWERFPRKTKLTADEALAYAARVLWYRRRRAAEKRRRLEAIEHPWWSTRRHDMLDAAE